MRNFHCPTVRPIDGLNIYPEKPAFISQPWQGGVAGKRVDTFALIPTRPGNFTLPPTTPDLVGYELGTRNEPQVYPAKPFMLPMHPIARRKIRTRCPHRHNERKLWRHQQALAHKLIVGRSDSGNTIEPTGE